MATDGISERLTFEAGTLIVGSRMLRLGDGTVSTGTSRGEVADVGKPGVGITRVGSGTSRL